MGLFGSIPGKLGLSPAFATPPSSYLWHHHPQLLWVPRGASDRCGGKAGRPGGRTEREAELEDLDRGPDEALEPR